MAPATEQPELLVADAEAWRAWLTDHHATSNGVWLILARKGTTEPTSLSYEQALQESLCHGWIDSTKRSRDEATYIELFTPRRRTSPWSAHNVKRVEVLIEEGRMQAAGRAEIDRAKADGRWDAAYLGPKDAVAPPDLIEALADQPDAAAMYERLSSRNRFAVINRIGQAKRPETRARRIAEFTAMLARGETIYPQKT